MKLVIPSQKFKRSWEKNILVYRLERSRLKCALHYNRWFWQPVARRLWKACMHGLWVTHLYVPYMDDYYTMTFNADVTSHLRINSSDKDSVVSTHWWKLPHHPALPLALFSTFIKMFMATELNQPEVTRYLKKKHNAKWLALSCHLIGNDFLCMAS